MWAAGVDGCGRDAKANQDLWIACLRPLDDPAAARFVPLMRFWDVLALPEAPVVVAVDMPIGFAPDAADGAGRACDRAARAVLGPRRSSVFAAPVRPAVAAPDKASAHDAQRAVTGRAMTPFAATLLTKMRELDERMTPEMQDRVVEAHPEIAFWALRGGRPCAHPKRSPEGRRERVVALREAGYAPALLETDRVKVGTGRALGDDLLDACVLSWTAGRIVRGEARRLPDAPVCDAKGLRMEIWG